MKLLIVSQYFWPESFVINALASALRTHCSEVVVVTGKPNYPSGRLFDGYSAAGVLRETFDSDIEIIRIPLRPRGSGGALALGRNYSSFVLNSWRLPWLLRGRAFDAILAYCPSPITSAIPAIPLKWLKGAHLAVWIQDLWPQSLEATGYIRSRVLLGLARRMVRMIYASADTLLVPSKAFVGYVAADADADKIVYYPNSLEPPPDTHEPVLPPELVHVLDTHFCVVFAGNVGTAQSIETIINAAGRVTDLADVRIVIVGTGSRLDWAAARIAGLGLTNVVLVGRFPPTAMPAIFRRAKGVLVTLTAHEIFSLTVPSKVQAYLAAGRPIIAALNGEGARIIHEAGAGLTCAAEDDAALAERVRELHALPVGERESYGRNGARYFNEHFEMMSQARRLVDILERRSQEKNRNRAARSSGAGAA